MLQPSRVQIQCSRKGIATQSIAVSLAFLLRRPLVILITFIGSAEAGGRAAAAAAAAVMGHETSNVQPCDMIPLTASLDAVPCRASTRQPSATCSACWRYPPRWGTTWGTPTPMAPSPTFTPTWATLTPPPSAPFFIVALSALDFPWLALCHALVCRQLKLLWMSPPAQGDRCLQHAMAMVECQLVDRHFVAELFMHRRLLLYRYYDRYIESMNTDGPV